ncbi:MAG: outer membrane protein assembly factor BamB precursor, partial [Verrucomicrobiota bacterium]
MSTGGERLGLCLIAAGRAARRWLAAGACAASIAAAAGDWPEFRGPAGQGIVLGADPPVEWSPGKNIAWKRALPGPGWSSPVVSEGRVYLTCSIAAADGNRGLHLLSCDAATGAIEWNTEIFPLASAPLRPGHDQSQPAGATPIVEGGRIYLYFGHHGAACLDLAGKMVWRNPRLLFDPAPANAGSPVIIGDRLVYLAEGATAPSIVALDKRTGKVLWRVRRTLQTKLKFSFGTSLAIAVGGRTQLIVPADGFVAALDPADGREIWRVRHSEKYAVIARPVFARGLLFVSAGYYRGELRAIRPDGAGDVTDSHVVWRTIKGAPITAGLVADGSELYAVNDAGVATCWEADTGRVVWQERLPG